MRRLTSHLPGGPETLILDEAETPQISSRELLVRVAACSVNYPDSIIITDNYQYHPPRPFAPGCEVAGTVEQVGEDVVGFAPGDRVMAMCGWGGMADKIALAAESCFKMPDEMPFDHGAAFIMTYATAYHALTQRAELTAGETLLVLGAAGGVGLASVEIGVALGAKVLAGASSEAKLEIVRDHGASDGFVYARGPLDRTGKRSLADAIKMLCPAGIHVVLDPVGGDLTEASVRGLAWGGRLLVVGFAAGIAAIPSNLLLLKGASAIGVFYGQFAEVQPGLNRANMEQLLALYASGRLRPTIAARYPLERGADAIAALSDQHSYGKIIVEVEPQ